MSRPKRFKEGGLDDPKACRMCKVRGDDFKVSFVGGKVQSKWRCKQCGHENLTIAEVQENGWNDYYPR